MRGVFLLAGSALTYVGTLVVAVSTAIAAPQGPASTPAANEAAATKTDARPLDRVVFIGASATAGFGVIVTDPATNKDGKPLPLAAAFEASVTSIDQTHAPRSFDSSLFFLSPGTTGPSQVTRALKVDPAIVIAVDFLFWFGYGEDDGKGGSLLNDNGRLEKLNLGLKELERFDPAVTIVVGDFPDMSAAVGKMLSPGQMPSAESLAALNARVREWAKGRPNTVLFPLSDLVKSLKSGQPITMAGIEFKPEAGRLIQSDELHPTSRGSLAMGLRIAELLREHFGTAVAIECAKDERTAQERAHQAAQRRLSQRFKLSTGGTTKEASPDKKSPAPEAPAQPTTPTDTNVVPKREGV